MPRSKMKPHSAVEPASTGYAADLIAAERRRQRRRWNLRHDDTHTKNELVWNAVDVLHSYMNTIYHRAPGMDEWGLGRKHHDDPEKLLCVGAALIQAELERLHRQRRKVA